MTSYADILESPVGPIGLAVDGGGAVTRISFLAEESSASPESFERELASFGPVVRDAERCASLRSQLEEYFEGARREFDLALAPRGTTFQKRVWEALTRIPYGTTRSYGVIARELGQPGASRAVGQANNKNPLPLVIPCHRVIGADGRLTGFGGGVSIKRALLDFENGQRTLQGELFPK